MTDAPLSLEQGSSAKLAVDRWSRYGTLVAFGLLLGYFALSLGSTFASVENVRVIFIQQSPAAIAALGLTVVLISGHLDLSIGAVVGLGAVLGAGLTAESGVPTVVALGAVLLTGIAVGAANALLILVLGLDSLIATLATGSICGGITLWYTGGSTIASGFPASMEAFGNGVTLGIDRPIVYVVLIAASVYFFLGHTVLGRNLYATGANPRAARLAGLRTGPYVVLGLLTCSALSAFAGFLVAARTLSGNPSVGTPFLLPAFAAAFLGAWTLSSGRFHVIGTLLAALLVAFSANGLVMSGVPFYFDSIFAGLVLIGAVAFGGFFGRTRR